MPPALLSDGGSMTVVRTLAAYCYGSYSVTWPDDYADAPVLEEGRQLGYVAKLPNAPKGKFFRRFVRADVTVNAVEKYSTMEAELDAAAERVGGDVLYTREITGPGLAGLVPGVDFRIGDVVAVKVWGKILRLPVVKIEPRTEVGAGSTWAVQVGSQLLWDSKELAKRNAEIDRAIAAERRERKGEISAAVAAESAARESALDEARATFSQAIADESMDRAEALAAERSARAEALAAETKARNDALLAEARARSEALQKESAARKEALQKESAARATAIQNAITGEQKARTEALTTINEEITAIEADIDDANKRVTNISNGLRGNLTGLDAEGKAVYDVVKSIGDAATRADNWTIQNQTNFNLAVKLAQSAQAKYNDFNTIQWLNQAAWNEEQAKINNANELFVAAQKEVNDINTIKWIDQAAWNEQQIEINAHTAMTLKTLEYADLRAEAFIPKKCQFSIYIEQNRNDYRVVDSSPYSYFRSRDYTTSDFEAGGFRVWLMPSQEVVFIGTINAFVDEVNQGIAPELTMSPLRSEKYKEGLVWAFDYIGHIPHTVRSIQGKLQIRFDGVLIPLTIHPEYQSRLDALKNEIANM